MTSCSYVSRGRPFLQPSSGSYSLAFAFVASSATSESNIVQAPLPASYIVSTQRLANNSHIFGYWWYLQPTAPSTRYRLNRSDSTGSLVDNVADPSELMTSLKVRLLAPISCWPGISAMTAS